MPQYAQRFQHHWDAFLGKAYRLFPALFDTAAPRHAAAAAAPEPPPSVQYDIDAGRHSDGSYILLPHIVSTEQLLKALPSDATCREVGAAKDVALHRSIIERVWEYLAVIDCESHFAAPVTHPSYLAAIPQSMDLSTIRLKIDRRKYRLVHELMSDVQLMLSNCFLYNAEVSAVYRAAERMRYAVYLVGRNVQSVLEDDASLAMQLTPEHSESSGASDGMTDASLHITTRAKEEVIASEPSSSTDHHPSSTDHHPSSTDHHPSSTDPHPSSTDPHLIMLESLKSAKLWINAPPVLEIALTGPQPLFVLPDLPPVLTDAHLRWATVMLRDASLQALFRKYFALRLRDLIVDTLSAHDSPVLLPCADAFSRQLFQLCQVSLTQADRIDPLDEHVLRNCIPLMIHATYSSHWQDPSAAAAAATGSSHPNALPREIVDRSLAHPAAVRPSSTASSCFQDPRTQRDFLESICRHLLNLKVDIGKPC